MRKTLPAIATGIALLLVVFGGLFPHLWYGEHVLSDADQILLRMNPVREGAVPYRDVKLEYPPLALPVLLAPYVGSHGALTLDEYQTRYSYVMMLLALVTSAVVTVTAARLGRGSLLPYRAAVAFAVFVVAIGATIVNRFDIAVALVIAVALLLLARRAVVGAGFVVGLGFALKIAPIALLPLVVLLASNRRGRVWAVVAAALGALVPYLPFLVVAPRGVVHSIAYHVARPLQIESLPGTFLLLRHWLLHDGLRVAYTFGSENLFGAGTKLGASLSSLATLAAFALVCWLLWRARHTLRDGSGSALALGALALMLASFEFGKVLSPQYLIWVLPLFVLASLQDLALGLCGLAATVLTQVEFPSLYPDLVHLSHAGIAVIAARNACLAVTFVLACVRLWKLKPATEIDAAGVLLEAKSS